MKKKRFSIEQIVAVQSRAARRQIWMDYIQPGKPQQNAYVERFNRTVGYECLSQYCWEDRQEVQLFATQWMYEYSHDRPSMALGGITPRQRLATAVCLYFCTPSVSGDYPHR